MTNEQIIKSLKCCGNEKGNMCSKCPKYSGDNDFCQEELHRFALDLINRLQAENERLKNIGNNKTKELLRHNTFIEELQEKLKTAKAEAYKEFAEKSNSIIDSLLEKYSITDFEEFKAICQMLRGLKNDTNNLLKELVGEDK